MPPSKGKTSYKNIFKATSLFGGTQIIDVFINLVRGKIIAILLGPAGMGLNGLFLSSVSMINNIAGLGLNYSAVRDISKSSESGDIEKLSRTLRIYRRWLFASALLGFIAVVSLSPLLSHFAFNSGEYTWAFMLLGFMVLFNILASGNSSLLQGTRNLKWYAINSLSGTLVALLVSAPLYFFFGVKAIVPALILSSLVTYILSIFYTSKVKTTKVKVSWKETYSGGLDMVKLGVAMMLATSIGSLVSYLLNNFIINSGSVADLGLYQAGMSITSQSIGLVFAAMAIDYYPRLSAISDDNNKVREMVNQQGEVTLLIATPILLLLIIAAPLVIQILLSKEFIPITGFIRMLAFGMMFKAASYSIGAISFAKGDKKVFFFLEGIYSNVSMLLFSVIGYMINGLSGLAWAFLLMHLVYFVLINIVTFKLYTFSLSRELKKVLLIQMSLMAAVFFSFKLFNDIYSYPIGSLLLLFSIVYSFKQLDRMIGIKEFINTKILRREN
ncbi:MAG: oligosaccharide flippase family protein [Rikenellaceae bacterium]